MYWGEFKLKEEAEKLANQLSISEEHVMEKFTALSLRKVDEDTGEQWQHHPMLGVYKILKKDKYING